MSLKIIRVAGPAALLVFAAPAFAENDPSPRNWAPRDTATGPAAATRPAPADTRPADDSFARNIAFIDAMRRQDSPAASAAPAPQPAAPAVPFLLDDEATARDAAPGGMASGTVEEVDLSALRYYAAQNNIARVAAEIRRLKARHPDWEVPQALFERSATVDEQPMWDLYGEGRLDAIYTLIRRQQQVSPGYVPSEELAEKLKIAEARRAIAGYVEAGRWSPAIAAARAVPGILVCQEMQSLWNVAQALGRTGAQARAFDLYSYILTSCPDRDERFATLQKAAAVLTLETLDELFALAGGDVGTSERIAAIRLDTLRGKIGEATGSTFGTQPTPVELAELSDAALATANPDDAALLGWFHYSRNAFDKARVWFDRSLQLRFTVKALEGYILALRQGGAVDEARQVALAYHAEDAAIAKLFIEIASTDMTDADPTPLEPERLAVFEEVVEEHRSALGAQSLGWYLYNEDEHKIAVGWFEKSMAWEPNAEAALGLAIALNRTGNPQGARELATTYGEDFPTLTAFVDTIGRPRPRPTAAARRVASGQSEARRARPARMARANPGGRALVRDAVQAYEAGDYSGALGKLETNRARGGETRDLALLRGWALHNAGKHREAHRLFVQLNAQQASGQALEGAVHSWRRLMPSRFH